MPSSRTSSGSRSRPSASSASLTSSATSITSGEADVGRRVEVEEDEVRPLGPVDPRVPRVHVDAAHVHHPEQRELVVDERDAIVRCCAAPSRVDTRSGTVGIQSGMCDGASFWKNALPAIAVGVAAHRERPVAEVRHEHGRDRAVVREQVALRDPFLGPEDLVEVRELDLAGAPCSAASSSSGERLLATTSSRRLVVAQALVRRLPQPAVVRPLENSTSATSSGSTQARRPCGRAASSAPRRAATSSRWSGRSSVEQPLDLGLGEARCRRCRPSARPPSSWTPSTSDPKLAAAPALRPSCSRRRRTPGGRASSPSASRACRLPSRYGSRRAWRSRPRAPAPRPPRAAPRRRRRPPRAGSARSAGRAARSSRLRRSRQRPVDERLAVVLEQVEREVDERRPAPAASPRSSAGPARRARRPRRR